MTDNPPLMATEDLIGFNATLGFRLVEWQPDHARFELPLSPPLLNRSGLVHGGVLATLLDAVMGYAGVFPIDGQKRRAVTLSMTTSYTGQAKEGVLVATGKRRGGGKSVFMAAGEVHGPDGALLAFGEGTYRYIASEPR